MMELRKLSEADLLEIVKSTDDLETLDKIASLKKLPRKVALEICKLKDPIANAAKITIATSKETDDDILVMLLDDLPGIEKAAWANIEHRIEKRGFKNKDAYYDVADLAVSQWKTGKSTWLLSFKALAQIFKDFEDFREDIVAIPGAMKDSEIKALVSKYLNESDGCNLLEASYILLAQQTESQSQLQKLTESQFESVREIAKAAIANLQSMNEAVDVTSFTIEKTANMKTASEKLKVFKALVSQSQSVSSNGNECEVKKNGMTVNFALVSYSSGGLYSLYLVYRVNGGEKMSVGLGEWEDNDEVQKQKVINDANKQVSFLKIKVDGDKYRANRWY